MCSPNQNLYNPETSDFLFPDWPHYQDRQFESTHLQPPSETNYLITNQNPQCCEASNPELSANAPVPVAEPYFLSGLQQAFGLQEHALTNQFMAFACNAYLSNEQCSGTSRTDEISHFISDFNGNLEAPANRISPPYETSSGIPILTVPNVHYNPMDPVPPTDAIGPIHSDKIYRRIPTERTS
ncbi:hypothetical protein CEXT_773931 [Caerostris extrusa]|uniref:Uncharacterized protein n=1 Tax=Caerostris extrusa TaxID=172846 RepID=A0AAV4RG12_CAEEX|nr:hypothetical protein CEXT_773931 [Caerostris extrusa]